MGFRFTLRTALVGLSLAAALSAVLAYAMRGHAWAISLTVGVLSLVLVFASHVAWHYLVRGMGGLLNRAASAAATEEGKP